jgi:phage pi2 protein 07
MWEGSPPRKNAFRELFLPSKQLVLHPCCFSLSSNRTNQGLNGSNEGVVKLELKKKAPSKKCLICPRKKISKNVKGWAYVSTCGEYCYHVKCVKDLVDKELEQQRSGGTNTKTLQLLEVRQKALKVG